MSDDISTVQGIYGERGYSRCIEHPADRAIREFQALPWYKRFWYWLWL